MEIIFLIKWLYKFICCLRLICRMFTHFLRYCHDQHPKSPKRNVSVKGSEDCSEDGSRRL